LIEQDRCHATRLSTSAEKSHISCGRQAGVPATTHPFAAVRYRQTVWHTEVPGCRLQSVPSGAAEHRVCRCTPSRKRSPRSSRAFVPVLPSSVCALPLALSKSPKLTEVCPQAHLSVAPLLPPSVCGCLADIPTHAPSTAPHKRRLSGLSACPVSPPPHAFLLPNFVGDLARKPQKSHKPKQITQTHNLISQEHLKPKGPKKDLKLIMIVSDFLFLKETPPKVNKCHVPLPG